VKRVRITLALVLVLGAALSLPGGLEASGKKGKAARHSAGQSAGQAGHQAHGQSGGQTSSKHASTAGSWIGRQVGSLHTWTRPDHHHHHHHAHHHHHHGAEAGTIVVSGGGNGKATVGQQMAPLPTVNNGSRLGGGKGKSTAGQQSAALPLGNNGSNSSGGGHRHLHGRVMQVEQGGDGTGSMQVVLQGSGTTAMPTINGKSQVKGGRQMTVQVSNKTRFIHRGQRQQASLADVRTGQHVRINLDSDRHAREVQILDKSHGNFSGSAGPRSMARASQGANQK
jgi:hypothetical protein